MLLRLLSLLCLLFLSPPSLAQHESATAQPEAVPETCPVIKASDNLLFPQTLIMRKRCQVVLGLARTGSGYPRW
jgi:hypothetical protein